MKPFTQDEIMLMLRMERELLAKQEELSGYAACFICGRKSETMIKLLGRLLELEERIK